MNSLSWIIYFIAFVEGMGNTLMFLVVTGFLVSAASLVIILASQVIISNFAAYDSEHDSKVWMANGYQKVKGVFKVAFAVWAVSLFVSIAIPEKKYIVMIAASEIGERLIQTEEAQKFAKDVTGLSGEATDLLREYIKLETGKIRTEIEKSIPKPAEAKQ